MAPHYGHRSCEQTSIVTSIPDTAAAGREQPFRHAQGPHLDDQTLRPEEDRQVENNAPRFEPAPGFRHLGFTARPVSGAGCDWQTKPENKKREGPLSRVISRVLGDHVRQIPRYSARMTETVGRRRSRHTNQPATIDDAADWLRNTASRNGGKNEPGDFGHGYRKSDQMKHAIGGGFGLGVLWEAVCQGSRRSRSHSGRVHPILSVGG